LEDLENYFATANVAVDVDSDRAVVESVAVQNNVGGTREVAEIAVAASVVEVEELAADSVPVAVVVIAVQMEQDTRLYAFAEVFPEPCTL